MHLFAVLLLVFLIFYSFGSWLTTCEWKSAKVKMVCEFMNESECVGDTYDLYLLRYVFSCIYEYIVLGNGRVGGGFRCSFVVGGR